jgi:hypothetical protein
MLIFKGFCKDFEVLKGYLNKRQVKVVIKRRLIHENYRLFQITPGRTAVSFYLKYAIYKGNTQ